MPLPMRESFLKIRPVKLHVGYLSNDTMNLYSASYSLGMLCTILTPLKCYGAVTNWTLVAILFSQMRINTRPFKVGNSLE